MIDIVRVDPRVSVDEAVLRAGAYVDMTPVTPHDFAPIDGIDTPDGPYALTDVETGTDLLDVTPDDALAAIRTRGRSPLTIVEGIALLAHEPAIIETRNAYSLAGSRRADKRVPAIWRAKDGRIRLGWCWAGNPHTWLGTASCRSREA